MTRKVYLVYKSLYYDIVVKDSAKFLTAIESCNDQYLRIPNDGTAFDTDEYVKVIKGSMIPFSEVTDKDTILIHRKHIQRIIPNFQFGRSRGTYKKLRVRLINRVNL